MENINSVNGIIVGVASFVLSLMLEYVSGFKDSWVKLDSNRKRRLTAVFVAVIAALVILAQCQNVLDLGLDCSQGWGNSAIVYVSSLAVGLGVVTGTHSTLKSNKSGKGEDVKESD